MENRANMMRAWSVGPPAPAATRPLVFGDQPIPTPGSDEVLVRVRVCGVCRTDLHLAEGDLEPKRPGVAPEAFAYRLPESLDDRKVAPPVVCRHHRLPLVEEGEPATWRKARPVRLRLQRPHHGAARPRSGRRRMTRGEANRRLARELGASFVAGPDDTPPALLDSAIIFAPAGDLVPVALRALLPGGTVALVGIHMSEIPRMDYADCLFGERDVRTVTANTRRDGEELLTLASRLPLTAHVTDYGFDAVDTALADIAAGVLSGSAVVTIA